MKKIEQKEFWDAFKRSGFGTRNVKKFVGDFFDDTNVSVNKWKEDTNKKDYWTMLGSDSSDRDSDITFTIELNGDTVDVNFEFYVSQLADAGGEFKYEDGASGDAEYIIEGSKFVKNPKSELGKAMGKISKELNRKIMDESREEVGSGLQGRLKRFIVE